MEAVIGAVFRDAGWEAARDLVLRLLGPAIDDLKQTAAAPADAPTGNAKGDLQELLQREGGATPRYLCLKEEGAAHDRLYEAAVMWGERELGRGTGKSKQEAEVSAARAALAVLRST
jgi:ribonuclease-3